MNNAQTSNIVVAKPWEGVENPIRNTDQPYLKFINSAVFQEEGRHFLKWGYYTNAPYGSKDYNDYWDEQERRVMNGYSVGGVRVTGRHYFYLNFCLIKARPIDPLTGAEKQGENRKIITLPRFLDHNYYWFNEFEKCVAEGPHRNRSKKGMIVSKSRRKGFTYQVTGGVYGYNFNFLPASTNILAAYEKGHYKVTLDGIHFTINHINKTTDWSKKQGKLSKRDHFRASFVMKNPITGVEIEDGYMSEVQAVSFKDNPFKSIGESTDLMGFEEAGKFEHLLTAYTIAEPTFRDGDIMTGIPLIWGCVCKGTKVWTNTGKLINIEDLKQDDGILGYNGNSISKEPIVWMKPPAKKSCYEIKTTGGNSIRCSNDHPLLTSGRNKRVYKSGRGFVYDATFTETEKIQVGDYLLMTTEVPVFGDLNISYARELGLMIGDGNYSVNSTPQLSIGEEEIYEYVNSKYNTNIIKQFLQKDNSNFRVVGLKELKSLIRKHGMYGQVKEDKRLPEDIDQFDRKSVSELIGGYFDADGNVSYNKKKNTLRLVLTSISYDLLEQVKYQLIKFGIGSSIYKENRNGEKKLSNGQKDHIYRLYISKKDDVVAFKNNITLLSKKKQELLNLYNIDGKRSMFRLKNVDFKLNPDNNKGTFFIDKINMKNLRYEQVISIKYIGKQEIYNLHTGISNTYLSNGFITKQTGGDMERGTKDFAEMYYNPEPYGLANYENIYDENATGDCGWFIDDMWYYPGTVTKVIVGLDGKKKETELPFVDAQGNSIRDLAEESLDVKRLQRKKGSRAAYNKFVTQQPKNPAEAFMRVQGTMFDTIRASARLAQIETNRKVYLDSIWKAKLTPDPTTQKIKFEYDDNGIPLYDFPIKNNKHAGCIEIYEMPVVDSQGEVPFGRYIAGIDPYDDDESTTNSVGSIIVLDLLTDRIVCHYKGRPAADVFFETCRRILKFYNAVANYERNKKGLYGYFYNKHCLHLLCDEPEILKDKGISKANTVGNNSKGTMGSTPVNIYGLQRSLAWMETPAYGEEEGSEVINLDRIRPVPILKEIIAWNTDDNFDDISALGMVMILREDRLQFKFKINKAAAKQVSQDDFFDRHFQGSRNSYTNRKIIDFIKTESMNTN